MSENKVIIKKTTDKVTEALKNLPKTEKRKTMIPIRDINKFSYMYMSGHGMIDKLKELEPYFSSDALKRVRTAITHIDKAMSEIIEQMAPDTFRQMHFYVKSHEVCMLPQKEKIKYLKKLGDMGNLMVLRQYLVKDTCTSCIEDPKTCKLKPILESCGTPYFYDYDNLDTLDEEDRKNAEHCGYCGGVGI